MRPRSDLGILLIHGIGSQREGNTLIQFGGAIHEWLSKWLKAADVGLTVGMRDTTLRSLVRGSPASMKFEFRHRNVVVQSWLLAEGWWAETLRAPTFLEFAKWAIMIIPCAVLLHFGQRARRANASISFGLHTKGSPESLYYLGKGLRGLTSIALVMPFVAFCGLVVQVALIVLLIPAIFPVDSIRSFLRFVQKALSATVGDSFVFLTNPVQEAAILTKARRDFDWLKRRCKKVVVIAHSQGAAVAYETFCTTQPAEGEVRADPDLLVTFGSGIRKLFDLRNALIHPGHLFAMGWGVVGCAAVMSAVLLSYWADWIPGYISLPVSSAMLVVSFWILSKTELSVRVDPAFAGVPVADYYSSHDPIPAGPLGVTAFNVILDYEMPKIVRDALSGLAGVEQELRVHNLGSVLEDHTAYWSNQDEFVSCIVADLASIAPLPSATIGVSDITVLDGQSRELARARRIWRVTRLVWMRRIAALAALGAVASQSPPMIQLGAAAKRIAGSLPKWLTARLDGVPSELATPAVVGSATVIAVTWVAYRFAVWGWRVWEERELTSFFSRSFYRTGGWGCYVFVLFTTALTAMCAWSVSTLILQAAGSQSGALLAFSLVVSAALLAWPLVRRGPGGEAEWAAKTVELGEHWLKKGSAAPRNEAALSLIKAYTCFRLVTKRVQSRKSTTAWAAAMHGCGVALVELAENPPTDLREFVSDYADDLIATANDRGVDTHDAVQTAELLRIKVGLAAPSKLADEPLDTDVPS